MENLATDTIRVCRTARPATRQFTQEIKVVGAGAIAKLLSAQAAVTATNWDVLNGEIGCGGTIKAKILYLDGEGARHTAYADAAWSEKIVCPVAPQDHVNVGACVAELTTTKSDTDTVTVRLAIEIEAAVYAETQVEVVKECPEAYLKTEEISSLIPFASVDQTFALPAEHEFDDVEGEIVDTDCAVCLTSSEARADSVMLEGMTVTDVLYKSTDGALKTCRYHTAFAQEIPAAGADGSTAADLQVCIVSEEQSLVAADGIPSVLKSLYTVRVTGVLARSETHAVVCDAFSVTRSLSCEYGEVTGGAFAVKNAGHSVEGSAMLEEGMPACDAVLGVFGARIGVANVYARDGRTVVEGLLDCNVLYFNKEYGTTNSVAVELPYSVVLNMESTETATGHATILELDARSVRAGKIDVSAEVMFRVRTCTECTRAALVAVGEGGAIEAEAAAMTVQYAVEGQELWDVAKSVGMTPENVLAQNPDVTFPTKGGEKLFFFRAI